MSVRDRLRDAFRRSPLYSVAYSLRQGAALARWLRGGRPVPPPHLVKVITVREYARAFDLDVLVETGTYMGDMIRESRRTFRQIISIELDPALCARARHLFKASPQVSIVEGDSGEKLAQVLTGVDRRALFWLDGHYSGGITARGIEDSPIARELAAIADHDVKGHVVLIDDARAFTGDDGYPSIRELLALARRLFPSSQSTVADDIVRIVTAP